MDTVALQREITPAPSQRQLAQQLVERLRPLATDPARLRVSPGLHSRGRQLFSYFAIARERIAKVRMPCPIIGIVLSGIKEFWIGERGQRFEAGMVFVLPGGVEVDVVNNPDPQSGLYEALVVEVEQVPPEIVRLACPRPSSSRIGDMRVRLTRELVDALAHAAIALHASSLAATLASHRLAEVLVLLGGDPAGRTLFTASLADRVSWLVLADPTRRWTAASLGRELGLGASTLRRRLHQDGTSLRHLLAAIRMDIAHRILTTGSGNVTEAACAAGYTSRSHFVRRFRNRYGDLPSRARRKMLPPAAGRG